jgi:DNA-binding XRE family transcriptional regulator
MLSVYKCLLPPQHTVTCRVFGRSILLRGELQTRLNSENGDALAVNTGDMKLARKISREGMTVRQARLRAGLTQEGLAQLAGVTTHTVWRIENERTFNHHIRTLRVIAKALSLSMSSLLNRGETAD